MSYIPILEKWLKCYDGLKFKHPESRESYKTKDGAVAVKSAISDLKVQEPVKPLRRHVLLEEASRSHVDDIGAKGILSNNSVGGVSVL